jgi:hypothetical protein
VKMIFSYDDDDDDGGGGGDDFLTHKMGCLWAWWVERVESWGDEEYWEKDPLTILGSICLPPIPYMATKKTIVAA